MPIVELLQEARSIGDVLRRLEHLANRPELRPMKIDVDLHASDIDQLGTTCPRFLHQTIGFRPAFRKKSLAFDVDRIGAERAFSTRLRQSYRIEDAFRNAVGAGCTVDLALAIDRRDRLRRLTGKRGQDERRKRDQMFQVEPCYHG